MLATGDERSTRSLGQAARRPIEALAGTGGRLVAVGLIAVAAAAGVAFGDVVPDQHKFTTIHTDDPSALTGHYELNASVGGTCGHGADGEAKNESGDWCPANGLPYTGFFLNGVAGVCAACSGSPAVIQDKPEKRGDEYVFHLSLWAGAAASALPCKLGDSWGFGSSCAEAEITGPHVRGSDLRGKTNETKVRAGTTAKSDAPAGNRQRSNADQRDPVVVRLKDLTTGEVYEEELFRLVIGGDSGTGGFEVIYDPNDGVTLTTPVNTSGQIDGSVSISGTASSSWLVDPFGDFGASLTNGNFTATGAWAGAPWTLTYGSGVVQASLPADYVPTDFDFQVPDEVINDDHDYAQSVKKSHSAYAEDGTRSEPETVYVVEDPGDWGNPDNWSAGVPTAGSVAHIDSGATVQIGPATPMATAGSLTVGVQSAFPSTVEQTAGVAHFGQLVLGWDKGTGGTYRISGGMLEANSLDVGHFGNGSLEIAEPAADVCVTGSLLFGRNATFAAKEGSAIKMTGTAVFNMSREPAALAGLGSLTMILQGGEAVECSFEVAGKDVGLEPAGCIGPSKKLYHGDTDLSGRADFDDAWTLMKNYDDAGVPAGKAWWNGDSDGDTDVDFDDAWLLLGNYSEEAPPDDGPLAPAAASASASYDAATGDVKITLSGVGGARINSAAGLLGSTGSVNSLPGAMFSRDKRPNEVGDVGFPLTDQTDFLWFTAPTGLTQQQFDFVVTYAAVGGSDVTAGVTYIPEPATLGVLVLGAPLLLWRRKRRS